MVSDLAVLPSEWTKLRTVRSTTGLLAAVLILIPAMAVLVALTGSLQPDDTVLGASLTGAILGQVLAGILGVLAMTSEYTTGTIRSTFAARPGRVGVLGAKAVVVAALTFAAALPACALADAIGTALLPGGRYARGEPMPAIVGVALSIAAIAVLGLAVGAAVRHPAAGIAVVIAVVVFPGLFSPLLGDLGRWVAGAAPAAAVQKLAQSSDAAAATMGSLSAWPSLWLVCGYAVAAWAGAAVLVARRDA